MAKKEMAIVTCENGHVIRHNGAQKKGTKKGLEVPKFCVRCSGNIVKVVKS